MLRNPIWTTDLLRSSLEKTSMAIPTSASSSSSRFVLSSPPPVRSTASSAFVEIPINGVLSRTTRACSQSRITGPNHKYMAVTVRASMDKVEQLNSGSDRGGEVEAEVAVDLFRSKLLTSPVPSVDELANLLNSIAGEKQFSEVVSLYEETKTSPVWPNTSILNIVMDCYCKLNNTKSAIKLLKKMKRSKGCKPDVTTYNTLIDGLCKDGNFTDALQLLMEMGGENCKPDAITCSLCETAIAEAFKLRNTGEEQNSKPEVVAYNTLIAEHCAAGNTDAALALFREMKGKENCKPDIVTYNTLIEGFYKAGETASVFEVLREMEEEDCRPNAVTYNMLILQPMIDGLAK